jgi:hypothetical protein
MNQPWSASIALGYVGENFVFKFASVSSADAGNWHAWERLLRRRNRPKNGLSIAARAHSQPGKARIKRTKCARLSSKLSSYYKENGPIKPPTFDTSNIAVDARGVAELLDAFDADLLQQAQEIIAHRHAPIAGRSAIAAAARGGGAWV